MSLTDWIISTSAGVIAILIGLVTYFAQKWFDSIEKTIEKHSSSIESLTKQVGSLESKKGLEAESISKAIQSQFSAFKFPFSKVDKIEQEVGLIKATVQEKLLPHSEKQVENLGRVIVLENDVKEQNVKLFKMFKTLERLNEKLQSGQRTPPEQK